MSGLIRFDGRVAVVTGAGNGLGRAYALLLAQRGASVVVNDLGIQFQGGGNPSSEAADKVVTEITSGGGKAVANYDSVVDGENIIKSALNQFGRIDILVNNAGIIRPKSFGKMSDHDWTLIDKIHLYGAFKTTRAAWDTFRSQQYGRIVNTSSTAGIFGTFGHANYSAAKSALLGFSATLAAEGEKFNIHSNCILPLSWTRMTEMDFHPNVLGSMKPEHIAPVVAWLCHEDCADSGMIIETAGGYSRRYRWVSSRGALLRKKKSEDVSIESVQENWNRITDMKNPHTPTDANTTAMEYLQILNQME